VTGVSSGTARYSLFFMSLCDVRRTDACKQTFGTDYESFRTYVPLWIPRLTPWRAAIKESLQAARCRLQQTVRDGEA